MFSDCPSKKLVHLKLLFGNGLSRETMPLVVIKINTLPLIKAIREKISQA